MRIDKMHDAYEWSVEIYHGVDGVCIEANETVITLTPVQVEQVIDYLEIHKELFKANT